MIKNLFPTYFVDPLVFYRPSYIMSGRLPIINLILSATNRILSNL